MFFRFPITLVRGSVVFPFPSVRVQFSVLDEDHKASVGRSVRRLRQEAEAGACPRLGRLVLSVPPETQVSVSEGP